MAAAGPGQGAGGGAWKESSGALLTSELIVKTWVFVSVYPETQGAVGASWSSCSPLGAAWIDQGSFLTLAFLSFTISLLCL